MTQPETPHKSSPTATAKTPLGASLAADYEALQNDFEQAQELAADFQRQLAGKSNEVAHFKAILEKAQGDFTRLEGHIRELREERHRLANEVMRVAALDMEIVKLRRETEQLREQLDTLNNASSKRVGELLVVTDEQQKEIQRLRAVVEVFRQREGVPPLISKVDTSEMQQQIAELTATVRRLQSDIRVPAAGSGHTGPSHTPAVNDADIINITFER
jgi:chromosome segregation ATPase